MAPRTVEYRLDDSTAVGFEIEPAGGWSDAGTRELAAQVKVREAVVPAVEAAKTVLEQIREIGPDGVEVKFGIKVTGGASWIVAKATAEANFEITLTWGRDFEQPAR